MITKDTAVAIAYAYREVETAEKLLAEISKQMDGGNQPDIRDAFGRQRGLQLGIPSGDNGHRLFDVPWTLARPIIETHIAAQRAVIASMTQKAVIEAGAVSQ